MPNTKWAQAITDTVNRYIELIAKGSADDLVELYADDATVEDHHVDRLDDHPVLARDHAQPELERRLVAGHP